MMATRARALVRSALGLSLVMALALVSGCGGGFNNTAPERSTGAAHYSHYVALGDGFASAPYVGRDASGNGCLRSADNYPAQVARGLKVSTITDVTCVGATTKDLTGISNPPRSKKKLAPQLDAITEQTDLVTIGIGIEDSGLLRNMFHICGAEPCGSDVLYPVLSKQLNAYGEAIASAVRTIKDVAPRATVVVVGYPQIMPVTGLCGALPDITENQLVFAFKILDLLNRFLESAALQTGSSYIDVAELSRDKTVCSTDPWISGSKTTVGKTQAFHPVRAEQDAVAKAIVDQVGDVSWSQQ